MFQTTGRTPGNNDISLVLSYAPLGLVRAIHTRIGLDEIMVDTGCVTLSNDSEVEILLTIRDGEQHMTYRIKARVSGSDHHGIKLAYQDCDHTTLKALMPYITLH